jgi:hypothetical protein
MDKNVNKALVYFYLSMVDKIHTGKVKGLKAKACMDFIKQIRDLSFAIDENRVIDFNEIVGGYFDEC